MKTLYHGKSDGPIEKDLVLAVGNTIGINFEKINFEQFRMGLSVELEHGQHDPETNVTNDDLFVTGKIAWAHLKEIPDYYTRLGKLEAYAKRRQP